MKSTFAKVELQKLLDPDLTLKLHTYLFQIHASFAKCNEKRMSSETEMVTYPTITSTLKAVTETGKYPQWSLPTWRMILLSMDFRLLKKSDTDNAILMESTHIINWRDSYLRNMQQHRFEGRPIFFTDETYIHPNSQPLRILTDMTVKSAKEAEERSLSTGIKRISGRGNRLLILHMIGPDGPIPECLRVWIRSDKTVLTEDYHNVSNYHSITWKLFRHQQLLFFRTLMARRFMVGSRKV